MTELEKLQHQYIEFLNKANYEPISVAHSHGWRCDSETVEKGKKLRFEIMLATIPLAINGFYNHGIVATEITFSPEAIARLKKCCEEISGIDISKATEFMGLKVVEEQAYDEFFFTIK